METQGPEFILQRTSMFAGVIALAPGLKLMEHLYATRPDLGDAGIMAICSVLPFGAWGLVQIVGREIIRRRERR